jgi:DNA end-binding protein Ku
MAKRGSKSTTTTTRNREFRSSWKGHIRFGLVSFAVEAVNALSRQGGDVHFHQLHVQCHNRIRYKKVCPVHGEVSQDEIVSGYEYQKGHYVEVEKEELDELRPERERDLSIDTFIAPSELDPIYLDGRMYYLIPDGTDAQEPYVLFREAMKRQKRWGIGHATMFGRDQLVLVRPIEEVLAMSLLNYEAEIRKPGDMADDVAEPKLAPKKVELAERLVETWTDDGFDFSKYKDHYQEKLKQLLEAKVQGREIVAPAEEPEPRVINLMDALEASVRGGRLREPNGAVRTSVRAAGRSTGPKRAVSRRRAAKVRSKRAS